MRELMITFWGEIKITEDEFCLEIVQKLNSVLNHIEPSQVKIMDAWYDLFSSHLHTTIDLIIYLKTDPETAFQRMTKRKRYEERNVKITYLEILNELYNQ